MWVQAFLQCTFLASILIFWLRWDPFTCCERCLPLSHGRALFGCSGLSRLANHHTASSSHRASMINLERLPPPSCLSTTPLGANGARSWRFRWLCRRGYWSNWRNTTTFTADIGAKSTVLRRCTGSASRQLTIFGRRSQAQCSRIIIWCHDVVNMLREAEEDENVSSALNEFHE